MKLSLRVAFIGMSILPMSIFAQGSLTPPGAPAPTMKTLDQVKPGTPITSAPYAINTPGSYYLTQNLAVTTGNAITITADGVTLDLNGFTITSSAASATGTAILFSGGRKNITITNGFIQGGVTNNGGTYSGSGFLNGIDYSSTAPINARAAGVSVSGCLGNGIYLGLFESTMVESCTVRTVGANGIVAATAKSSVAKECGLSAISAGQAADSRAEATGNSTGLLASTALNCYGQSGSGIGLNAVSAQNCYGLSTSGTGLFATVATGCYGNSNSGVGLQGDYIAINCLGVSSSGRGLFAAIATNCFGVTTTGDLALFAQTANTCRGWQTDGTGTAILADIAIGCTTAGGTITGQKFLGTP